MANLKLYMDNAGRKKLLLPQKNGKVITETYKIKTTILPITLQQIQ